MEELYMRIWNGSMPGLISGKFTDRNVFYSSYLQTYIERDVSESVTLTDNCNFRTLSRSCLSCRTNVKCPLQSRRSVGISDDTAKRWLQVLEKIGYYFFISDHIPTIC